MGPMNSRPPRAALRSQRGVRRGRAGHPHAARRARSYTLGPASRALPGRHARAPRIRGERAGRGNLDGSSYAFGASRAESHCGLRDRAPTPPPHDRPPASHVATQLPVRADEHDPARVPAVLATVHLYVDLDLSPRELWQQRMLTHGVDRYLAVSNDSRNKLVTNLHWPADKIEVVHNAVWERTPASRGSACA